jgi:hypothetical protein
MNKKGTTIKFATKAAPSLSVPKKQHLIPNSTFSIISNNDTHKNKRMRIERGIQYG